MTPNKAREFYSDYLEGTLDSGLRDSFERALARDAELQYDFDSFKETMGRLSHVEKVEAAAPADLFDRISQRVDPVFQTQTSRPRLWLFENLRPVLAVGAAAAVIGLTVLSLKANGSTGPNQAGPGGLPTFQAVPPTLQLAESGETSFLYRPTSADTVTLKDGETGEVLETKAVAANSSYSTKLVNPRAEAGVMIVEVKSQMPESMRVVLPGLRRASALTGKGTVLDLAKSLSVAFGRPIRLDIQNQDRAVSWSLKTGASTEEVNASIKELGLSLDEMKDGLFVLKD